MSISGNIRAGAAYVEVTAQTSKLQRGLATAQAQLQQFGRSCTSIGKDMLMLSGAFAVPLAMAVKGFAAFDDQMRLAKAVTKATKAEFESMTQVAAKLGRETSFTAKQVADGMVSLGRMGFSPKEIEASIQPTLDLARATGTELGEAADIAANAMRIFGIEASKMSDVADVLTATANGSAQTLTDLFEALKMAGPQAKAAGENITDTSAAIGILANVGIKGSLAGTALRKSYSQFAKTKVQDKLKAIGITTVDANGNLRKMADIMADIGMAMSSMPSAEKISFAEEIFDIRGSLAGLSLGGNVKELQAFIEKLQNIRGTARTTAKEMDDGLGGSFRMLMSAVEGAMNAIAKALEGTLKPLVDRATEVTLAIIKWIEANSGLVTGFAVTIAGAAALGAALIVIGVAAKGAAAGIAVISTAVKGFTFLQGVCIAQGAALKNSISLIATAFVNFRNTAIPAMVGTEQLCAALGLASSASNRAAASIVLMSNAEAAAAAKSFLAARWVAMTEALKNFRNSAIVATVATKAQAAAEMAAGAKNAIVAGWVAMTNALKGLTTASVAATVATKAQAAAELAMSAKNAIVSGWIAMTNALKGLSAATVAATAVTYAHTAAEAICTAGTVALNKARQLAAATTALFTAANLKAVVSISAVAVGNFLLAAAAKVAAIAMMGLTAVMTAVAAHPVAAALIALGVILAGVVIYLYRAANYTAKLSDQMSKLREKNDEVRKSDQLRMERLKQLSEKQHLTNAEMKEAQQLAKELKSRYGDLGISITDNAMRITAMNSAVSKLGTVQLRVENKDDLDKIQRLKALTVKVNLAVPEQNEAAALIEELSGKYGDLGLEVDRAKKRVILLSDATQRLQGIRMTTRIDEPDFSKFDRLKNLTMEAKLSVSQQGDAEALIRELSRKYGDLGLVVDKASGKIRNLNTVAGAMADLSFRVRGMEDIQKLQRLKNLSMKADLDVEGREEATRLIEELSAKYGDLGLSVESAGAKMTAVNDALAHMNQVQVMVDNSDLKKFDRLKRLSMEAHLTVEGQDEAAFLIADLSKRYGNLGIEVDRTSGKIAQLNTVAANIRDAELRVTAKTDLEKLNDLRNLSFKSTLTVEERGQAEAMIRRLEEQYGNLGIAVDRASGKIVALNDAASRVHSIELGVTDNGDLKKFQRLKDLSMTFHLNTEGQQEAENLIEQLKARYGDLGLAVDEASGRIVRLNTAAGNLQDVRFRIRGDFDQKQFDRLKDLSLQGELSIEGQEEANRIITDLTKKYGSLGVEVDRTSGKIQAVNAGVARIGNIQFRVNADDLKKFDRLKALTQTVKLDVQGQREAAILIDDLSKKYGDLGLTVDRASGKIVRMNTVAGNMRAAELKIKDQVDLGKLHDIQGMSLQPKLTISGMDSAEQMIGELERKYGSLGIAVDRTSGKIVAMNDAASRVRNIELGIQETGDWEKFQRLKDLTQTVRLDVQGQKEAVSLIAELSQKYGDLGVTVDKASGKIVKMNTVAGNLKSAELKITDSVDLGKLHDIQGMSLQPKLTISGMDSAEKMIGELEQKYGSLGVTVDRASGKIVTLNDAASRVRNIELGVTDNGDLKKFERLKELSMTVRLNTKGQKEAESLIAGLSQKYGDLGLTVDKTGGQIVKLNSVAGNLQDVRFKIKGDFDEKQFERLQNLSMQGELDIRGQEEAARLIADLSGKYGSLGVEVDRVSGKIQAVNDAAARISGIQLRVDTADLDKLSRLKTLSMQAKLDVRGQDEAETLIADLSKRYGDLGLTVDKTSGRIQRMNTISGKLQDIRFRIQGEEDLKKFDRLKELSAKVTLTSEGQAEAERLVAELSAKYGDLGIAVDRASTRITAMNAEAARLKAIEPEVKEPKDLAKLKKLEALSLELRLDVQQQTEAEAIIAGLSAKYGDLGVAVDRASGKIVKLNSVAASLREINIKVSGTEDADKAARLQQLAALPKLDSSGMSEASTLIDQLSAKYGNIGLSVDNANGRIVALTEAQKQFANAQNIIQAGNDPLKETHLAQLERLKKLSEQEKLTAEEQQEAQSIVNGLNGAYNGLGLGIDAITGKLTVAADAQKKLNDAMKQATLSELDAEIAEMETNIKELQKENEALMSYWNHNLWSQMTGRQKEAVGKIETNGDRMAAYRQKIGALRQRKRAVQEEKPGAATGTDGKSAPTTEENIAAEKQRRMQPQDAAADAAKRVAEIDKKLARERKTDLENEIDDIIALRDEYKALIQTMLDYEKSKPEGQRDSGKIAELEGKLAQADKTAQDRIAKAQEKAAEKMRKDVADFQKSFDEAQKDVQTHRAEEAQDRDIESTLQSDKSAGIQKIQALIRQYQLAAEAAKKQFQQELQAAQADGKIDDGERERISAAQAAYTRAESLVDKYSGKLRDAQDGTQTAADEASKVNGSFLAAALNAALGGGGSEAERTANATEMMAKNSKETNRILKKMKTGSDTTLTYA